MSHQQILTLTGAITNPNEIPWCHLFELENYLDSRQTSARTLDIALIKKAPRVSWQPCDITSQPTSILWRLILPYDNDGSTINEQTLWLEDKSQKNRSMQKLLGSNRSEYYAKNSMNWRKEERKQGREEVKLKNLVTHMVCLSFTPRPHSRGIFTPLAELTGAKVAAPRVCAWRLGGRSPANPSGRVRSKQGPSFCTLGPNVDEL